VIVLALSHLLASHPHQALWHLSGLAQSLNEARRQAGSKVITKAIQVRISRTFFIDHSAPTGLRSKLLFCIVLQLTCPLTRNNTNTTFDPSNSKLEAVELHC
jgi:hypothetical protein